VGNFPVGSLRFGAHSMYCTPWLLAQARHFSNDQQAELKHRCEIRFSSVGLYGRSRNGRFSIREASRAGLLGKAAQLHERIQSQRFAVGNHQLRLRVNLTYIIHQNNYDKRS